MRFLLELAALAALGWWGSTEHWALAVVLPLAAATLWGLYASPKARYGTFARRLAIEVLVFGGAAAALVAADRVALAAVFAAVAAVDGVLVRRLA